VSFQPKRDHILVKADPLLDHVSTSGLLIKARNGIQTSQEQLGRTGTVMAVGPGKLSKKGIPHPPELSVGDKVLLGEWEYPELEPGLLVASWQDVCAVLY
jgi:chaperonin GroES